MRLDGFLGTDDEEFEWALRLNFFIALKATRAVIPTMAARGSGSIVNVVSVNAFFEPDAGVLDYGAAKAALLNLTKSLAQEFGASGVRVNAISRPVPSPRTYGSDRAASQRPSRRPPASTPTPLATKCSPESAVWPPAA
jgi:NAD(P)-dependent dehydrogenase (short-subunit alcohol dehydrogenase family)